MDNPPTKKPRGPQAPPEFHIAVNIAPTSGVGGAIQGSYVISQSTIEASTAAPRPLSLEKGNQDTLSTEGAGDDIDALTEDHLPPPGREITVRKATRELIAALAKCTETGVLLNTKETLELMDSEDPEVEQGPKSGLKDRLGATEN